MAHSPSTYALTLSREDVMVWIMNHDVSTPWKYYIYAWLTITGDWNREGELEQHDR